MSITDLANRYINEHLYEWAYDEGMAEFKLWRFFHCTEWPVDAKITVRQCFNRLPVPESPLNRLNSTGSNSPTSRS